MTRPAVECRGLTKRYDDQTALAGIDLAVDAGAFCVLLGPSGCGKSTLLRTLAGLEAPTEGSVTLSGRVVADQTQGIQVAPGARNLGMVFQSYALWPHKTARENIDWPLKIAGLSMAERKRRLSSVADMLGLEPYLARYPAELSGGQQQRVAIARSIAPGPGLLLFDEPLSNLDASLRMEMRMELLKVHRETGTTIIYVTHDQVEAITMATQIVVMNEGVVEQDGPVETILEQPQTAFVAGFVGNPPANLLDLHLEQGKWRFGRQQLTLNGLPPEHAAVRAMVRPSRIGVFDVPGARRVQARFVEALPFGAQHFLQLEAHAGRITALVDAWVPRPYGAGLYVELPETPDALFGVRGERIL